MYIDPLYELQDIVYLRVRDGSETSHYDYELSRQHIPNFKES